MACLSCCGRRGDIEGGDFNIQDAGGMQQGEGGGRLMNGGLLQHQRPLWQRHVVSFCVGASVLTSFAWSWPFATEVIKQLSYQNLSAEAKFLIRTEILTNYGVPFAIGGFAIGKILNFIGDCTNFQGEGKAKRLFRNYITVLGVLMGAGLSVVWSVKAAAQAESFLHKDLGDLGWKGDFAVLMEFMRSYAVLYGCVGYFLGKIIQGIVDVVDRCKNREPGNGYARL